MDDLVWVNRELEEKLQGALREQEAMDALLDEMEDENEDAFARIHALEAQVYSILGAAYSFFFYFFETEGAAYVQQSCILLCTCQSSLRFIGVELDLLSAAQGAEAGEHAAERAQGQVHVGQAAGARA